MKHALARFVLCALIWLALAAAGFLKLDSAHGEAVERPPAQVQVVEVTR